MSALMRATRKFFGWWTAVRLTALIAVLALAGSVYNLFLYKNELDAAPRQPTIKIEDRVRNVSARQAVATTRATIDKDQQLEFVTRVINLGQRPLNHVTLSVAIPDSRVGDYQRGTCTLTTPARPKGRHCDDSLSESALNAARLNPGESMTVTYEYRTKAPYCEPFSTRSSSTADSDESDPVTDYVDISVQDDSADRPACGTPDADLLALIPSEFRITCELDVGGQQGQPLAAISCSSPDPSVVIAEYERFATADEATAVFRRRNASIRHTSSCNNDPDGRGRWSYEGTSHWAGRYLCYVLGGHAWLEWTDTENRIYGFAEHAGQSAAQLYDWFNDRGGP